MPETNLSVHEQELKLLKTKFHLRLRVPNLILCTAQVSAKMVKFLIWLFNTTLYIKAALGSLTVTAGSARAEIIKNDPELAEELEKKIKDTLAEQAEKARQERAEKAKANSAKVSAQKPEKKITREEALEKINIMVEDDED